VNINERFKLGHIRRQRYLDNHLASPCDYTHMRFPFGGIVAGGQADYLAFGVADHEDSFIACHV
jgi:hypothetical protein